MKYNIREWQLYEVSIMDKVVDICNQYHIRYYLSSGTLLGAIRHDGFIPWDDDIDIDMPINDYKKFCKIAPKELEKRGCFFQTYHTDPEYNGMWAMVRANGTTSMPVKQVEWDIHWGIHVDIFPLIGLYKNPLLRKLQYKLFGINETLLEKDYATKTMPEYHPGRKARVLYSLPRRIRHLLVDLNNLIIDHSFDKAVEASEKWYKLEPNYRPEYYINTTDHIFEGKYYKIPVNYDQELTLMYGDYMTPPPLSERDGHEMLQGDTIRDLTKDYKFYIQELRGNRDIL